MRNEDFGIGGMIGAACVLAFAVIAVYVTLVVFGSKDASGGGITNYTYHQRPVSEAAVSATRGAR